MIILHKRKKILVVPKIDFVTYLTNQWLVLYSDSANICGGEGWGNVDVCKGDPTTLVRGRDCFAKEHLRGSMTGVRYMTGDHGSRQESCRSKDRREVGGS